MPLISVVMPIYNNEQYVGLAIESILNQTFRDFEFLIFNDGSTDRSQEIICSFNDSRIKAFDYSINTGYVTHLNHGIEIATGKYIARMDADDISLPDRFERQIKILENNPEIGLCGAWIQEFDITLIPKDKGKIYRYASNHDAICVKLMRHNSFAHPVVMMRRNVLIDHNLRYEKEYVPSEDYQLWVKMKKFTK